MRRVSWSVILPLMASFVGADASAEQVAWRWDKDAGFCQLVQQVGSSDDRLVLGRPPGADLTAVTLEVAATGQEAVTPTEGVIRLSDGGSGPAELVIYSHPSGSRMVIASSQGRSLLPHLAASNSLEIVHPSAGTMKVPIIAAAAAVEALKGCEDRTLKSWGIDPAGYWALSSRPLPLESPLGLFSGDDYPARAQAMGIESTVVAKLDIARDGTIAKCTVLSKHQISEFKDVVCNKLGKQARFNPARNSAGAPVPAPYVAIVRFRLSSD